jgi:hypothetical protein
MWLRAKFDKKRERTREEVIDNSITKGFIICTSHHVVVG